MAEPAQTSEGRGVPALQESAHEGAEPRDASTSPAPASPKERSTGAAAKERVGQPRASRVRGSRGGQSQRALISAHNEAVLAEAAGSDQALAQNLAEQELQVTLGLLRRSFNSSKFPRGQCCWIQRDLDDCAGYESGSSWQEQGPPVGEATISKEASQQQGNLQSCARVGCRRE